MVRLNHSSLFAVLVLALCVTLPNAYALADQPPEFQTIVVEVDVPSNQFQLAVDEVYEIDEELWVISTLKRTKAPKILIDQAIKLSDVVGVFSDELPVRYFFVSDELGDARKGLFDERVTYIESKTQLSDDMIFGKRLYSAADE